MMAKSGNRTYGKRDAGVWACRMQGALVRRTGIVRFVSDNGGWRENGGKVRVRFRGQWFVRGMLWKRNRSISFHFVC